jgi:hypothetical protein
MSISKFFARVAFASAFAWVGGSALGADVVAPRPVAPAVVGGAPAVGAGPVIVEGEGGPGCASCQHGAAAGTCSRCDKWLSLHKRKTPLQVSLCPGACFGYFQTQWRKWDEVCPYPYQGTGPAVGALPPPGAKAGTPAPMPGGAELNPPRTLDPKAAPKMPEPKKPANTVPPSINSSPMKGGSDLPIIPQAPGKFVP